METPTTTRFRRSPWSPFASYVAKVGDDLAYRYHGCSNEWEEVWASIDKEGNVLDFGYRTTDDAEPNFPWRGETPNLEGGVAVVHGWASCWEIGIDRGSQWGALLKALNIE